MKFYIRGGIGDFLQSYQFVKNNLDKEYIVSMHFKNAKFVFDEIGASNCVFYDFEDLHSLTEQTNSIIDLFLRKNKEQIHQTPRSFYDTFNFGQEANLNAEKTINSFETKKEIIGIHPFRSDFANYVYNQFEMPAKILPADLIKEIIDENKNYLIFGSEKELLSYELKESKNIKHICFKNIFHSLSTVKYCSALIGLDSCFKSMSSMQKIKTLCIIGDFEDATRDDFFIKKYVDDKIMKVYKTKNVNKEKEEIIKFIKINL